MVTSTYGHVVGPFIQYETYRMVKSLLVKTFIAAALIGRQIARNERFNSTGGVIVHLDVISCKMEARLFFIGNG